MKGEGPTRAIGRGLVPERHPGTGPRFHLRRVPAAAGELGVGAVEGLVILVTLAILGLTAIPPYLAGRERSRVEAAISSLQSAAVLQEAHFESHRRYADRFEDGALDTPERVDLRVVYAGPGGWSAQARHQGSESTCTVFYGNAPPVAPASIPGVITCDR